MAGNDRAASGIEELDRSLGGGFPVPSAVLVEGPLESAKVRLLYSFVKPREGLVSDRCVFVIRGSPEEVIRDARAYGLELDQGTVWVAGGGGGQVNADLEDLASLSFSLKEILRGSKDVKVRIAFDVLSPVLMKNSPEGVYRFLDQLVAELKRHRAVLLATIEPGMHSQLVLSSIEQLFDGVLAVEPVAQGQGRHPPSIRIRKMEGLAVEHWEQAASVKGEPVPAKPGTRRIAVLPFVNMSPDPNDEYFADGLTEELIDRLCQIRELEVIARTSVMAYRNKEKKAAEIGGELSVGSLVEGSVRKAGNKIRVTAQLIDVRTEGHLWSSRYDSELQDIFAVQSDMAEKITAALKLRLIEGEKEKIGRRATSNLEAYVAYLNGVYSRYKGSFEGLTKAAEYNSRAIELDPNYAEAFAQLAMDHIFLGAFWGEPVVQAFSKAAELAAKALELGPNLSEAHYAKSWVSYYYEMDWRGAEREAKTAIELKPSYAEPRNTLAWTLLALGRNDEALGEARKAVDLDPLGVYSYLVLAHVLAAMGKFDEAILWHTKTVEIADTPYFRSELGYTYLSMGKLAEGVKEMEKATEEATEEERPFFRASLGYGYAVSGRREGALKIASEMQLARAKGMARPYDIAMIYAGLGEDSMALDLLEEAYQEHSIVHLLPLNVEPAFANLRSEPRFRTLLRKLNLAA